MGVMRNYLSEKERDGLPSGAYLSGALLAVPGGMAVGLAVAAVRLMPQLGVWDILMGIVALAGYSVLVMLQGTIPLLFLYFLLCRAGDWLMEKGRFCTVFPWVMVAAAGAVSAASTGYCYGLWQEYAAVETRLAAAVATMLLMLPAKRGYCLFSRRSIINAIYYSTLIFCLVLAVINGLWGKRHYHDTYNAFFGGYGYSRMQIPLLPQKQHAPLHLSGGASYTPAQDNETFCQAVGKALPEGCEVIRTGYYNTGAIFSLQLDEKTYREYCAGFPWQEAPDGTCFSVDSQLLVSPEDFHGGYVDLSRAVMGDQYFLLRDDARCRLFLLLIP